MVVIEGGGGINRQNTCINRFAVSTIEPTERRWRVWRLTWRRALTSSSWTTSSPHWRTPLVPSAIPVSFTAVVNHSRPPSLLLCPTTSSPSTVSQSVRLSLIVSFNHSLNRERERERKRGGEREGERERHFSEALLFVNCFTNLSYQHSIDFWLAWKMWLYVMTSVGLAGCVSVCGKHLTLRFSRTPWIW